MDRNEPGPSPSAVRDKALGELADGRLTAERLSALASGRADVLYDLVELPYEGADVDAVDTVRRLALEAATRLVPHHDSPEEHPG